MVAPGAQNRLTDGVGQFSLAEAGQINLAVKDLWIIFGPTGAWDDEIGAQGMELADQVLLLLNELSKGMRTTTSTPMK